MRASSSSRGPRAGGFTLLEVLVALAIIAVALTAALRGAMALTSNSRDVDLKLFATMTAENRLLELRFGRTQVSPGDADFDCQQPVVVLHCHQNVTSTPNPFFRRAEVRVDSGGDNPHQLADLMALLPSN